MDEGRWTRDEKNRAATIQSRDRKGAVNPMDEGRWTKENRAATVMA